MPSYYMSVCNSGCCQTMVKHENETCGPKVVCQCTRTCPKCQQFDLVLEYNVGAKKVALNAIRFIEELCVEGGIDGMSPTQMWRKRRARMVEIVNQAKAVGLST